MAELIEMAFGVWIWTGQGGGWWRRNFPACRRPAFRLYDGVTICGTYQNKYQLSLTNPRDTLYHGKCAANKWSGCSVWNLRPNEVDNPWYNQRFRVTASYLSKVPNFNIRRSSTVSHWTSRMKNPPATPPLVKILWPLVSFLQRNATLARYMP